MSQFANATQPGNPPPALRATEQAGARLLVVAGGRLGVGCTTVAACLASELARDAQRIVLVDANLDRPGIAGRCGLSPALTIADVLSGRKTIHEALERGPAGMQVLAATATAESPAVLDERSIGRLLRQLSSLSPHADWLIVDVGHQTTQLAARLWAAADQSLLVTAADAVAVMDTYALVKTLQSRAALRCLPGLIVNRVEGSDIAADVHRRIDQSCRRFLGVSLPLAAALAPDEPAATIEPGTASVLAAALAPLCKLLLDPRLATANGPLAA